MLSVRSDETDKIAVLDGGANDYVTKPFSSGEPNCIANELGVGYRSNE